MEHESLLLRLKAGSESAWDEAFQILYPVAFAAARHPLTALSPSDAEDVAIEALTMLVPKIEAIQNWDEMRAMTATIAARRAISFKRKQTADKRGGGQTDSLDALNEKTEGHFEPAALLDSISAAELLELSELLDQAMVSLDEMTKNLIHDFIVEEIPYKDLAQKHSLPIGSVGVYLARGLKKIRSKIEQNPKLLKEINPYLRLPL